ncbi:hypothetical protein B0H11DRAFT_2009581 [Mycena galericulata]|nr:hypothetical protein B0H11DRAFT_2009581 [Mycena galericulata]
MLDWVPVKMCTGWSSTAGGGLLLRLSIFRTSGSALSSASCFEDPFTPHDPPPFSSLLGTNWTFLHDSCGLHDSRAPDTLPSPPKCSTSLSPPPSSGTGCLLFLLQSTWPLVGRGSTEVDVVPSGRIHAGGRGTRDRRRAVCVFSLAQELDIL